MAYFPMMMNLEDKTVLVVGGGSVAFRKIEVLQEFGAKVIVVAPNIIEEVETKTHSLILKKEFSTEIVEQLLSQGEIALAVVATNEKELNHKIAEILKSHGILVNAVDQVEDCDFIFPALVKKGELVAAFSSGGQSPVVAQYMKEEAEQFMTEQLAEFSNHLGEERERIKKKIPNYDERKEYYHKQLQQFREDSNK